MWRADCWELICKAALHGRRISSRIYTHATDKEMTLRWGETNRFVTRPGGRRG